ncbi:MAG: hypothetical protein KC431_22775, partial [Myxococcales bacterium]|nr:hypothetical protein [Myxococcales bacterium]
MLGLGHRAIFAHSPAKRQRAIDEAQIWNFFSIFSIDRNCGDGWRHRGVSTRWFLHGVEILVDQPILPAAIGAIRRQIGASTRIPTVCRQVLRDYSAADGGLHEAPSRHRGPIPE